MIGSLFAGHIESPGKTVEVDGEAFKEYYGSASEYQKAPIKMLKVRKYPTSQRSSARYLDRDGQDLQVLFLCWRSRVADLKHVDYVIVKILSGMVTPH